MGLNRTDLAMFVYNVAVVLTGGYLVMRFDIESVPVLVGVSTLAGVLWTVYYHVSMADRLEGIRTGSLYGREDDDADESEGPTDERDHDQRGDDPADETAQDEEDRRGMEPPWE